MPVQAYAREGRDVDAELEFRRDRARDPAVEAVDPLDDEELVGPHRDPGALFPPAREEVEAGQGDLPPVEQVLEVAVYQVEVHGIDGLEVVFAP